MICPWSRAGKDTHPAVQHNHVLGDYTPRDEENILEVDPAEDGLDRLPSAVHGIIPELRISTLVIASLLSAVVDRRILVSGFRSQ